MNNLWQEIMHDQKYIPRTLIQRPRHAVSTIALNRASPSDPDYVDWRAASQPNGLRIAFVRAKSATPWRG
jgi:hypothetical protein